MSKLKIAVDVGPLSTGDAIRGIGVYTRELLNALELLQKEKKDEFEVYPVDYFNAQGSTRYNIVHFTRFNPFRISVPFRKPSGTKFVLTIYDLIPLIYPKHYPPGVKGWIKWQINKYLIGKNIDTIITISETSKKDICRFIGVDPKKVVVTYLAPRSAFKKLEKVGAQSVGNWKLEITKRFSLPKRFVLYVGDINYNKNIPNLVKACKLAGIKLVIAGRQAADIDKVDIKHPENKHLKNIEWDEVVRLGFVTDEDLVNIYNLANVYIQPSFYEGFGLPLLEAQASGVPVVASKTQALVEIAGDSALFVDPKDAKDFTVKINQVLNDSELKNDLIKRGFENSHKYSWKNTVLETINKIYKN